MILRIEELADPLAGPFSAEVPDYDDLPYQAHVVGVKEAAFDHHEVDPVEQPQHAGIEGEDAALGEHPVELGGEGLPPQPRRLRHPGSERGRCPIEGASRRQGDPRRCERREPRPLRVRLDRTGRDPDWSGLERDWLAKVSDRLGAELRLTPLPGPSSGGDLSDCPDPVDHVDRRSERSLAEPLDDRAEDRQHEVGAGGAETRFDYPAQARRVLEQGHRSGHPGGQRGQAAEPSGCADRDARRVGPNRDELPQQRREVGGMRGQVGLTLLPALVDLVNDGDELLGGHLGVIVGDDHPAGDPVHRRPPHAGTGEQRRLETVGPFVVGDQRGRQLGVEAAPAYPDGASAAAQEGEGTPQLSDRVTSARADRRPAGDGTQRRTDHRAGGVRGGADEVARATPRLPYETPHGTGERREEWTQHLLRLVSSEAALCHVDDGRGSGQPGAGPRRALSRMAASARPARDPTAPFGARPGRSGLHRRDPVSHLEPVTTGSQLRPASWQGRARPDRTPVAARRVGAACRR